MKYQNLKNRFMRFALDVVAEANQLPPGKDFGIVQGQLIRSSTSSAANYRASGRSKSTRDFINKLKIVEEELDETSFWIEFLILREPILKGTLQLLKDESNELLAIVVKSIKTAKENQRNGTATKIIQRDKIVTRNS